MMRDSELVALIGRVEVLLERHTKALEQIAESLQGIAYLYNERP